MSLLQPIPLIYPSTYKFLFILIITPNGSTLLYIQYQKASNTFGTIFTSK